MYTVSALFTLQCPFLSLPPNENTFRRPWYSVIDILIHVVYKLNDHLCLLAILSFQ